MSARQQVLVIDDSEPDLVYAQIVLERSGLPVEVQTCESAAEALAGLRSGRLAPALILLDLNMPGMGGFDFLQAYSALPSRPAAPVVVLTSSPDPRDRERALAFDTVRDYITKPFDEALAAGLARFVPT